MEQINSCRQTWLLLDYMVSHLNPRMAVILIHSDNVSVNKKKLLFWVPIHSKVFTREFFYFKSIYSYQWVITFGFIREVFFVLTDGLKWRVSYFSILFMSCSLFIYISVSSLFGSIKAPSCVSLVCSDWSWLLESNWSPVVIVTIIFIHTLIDFGIVAVFWNEFCSKRYSCSICRYYWITGSWNISISKRYQGKSRIVELLNRMCGILHASFMLYEQFYTILWNHLNGQNILFYYGMQSWLLRSFKCFHTFHDVINNLWWYWR